MFLYTNSLVIVKKSKPKYLLIMVKNRRKAIFKADSIKNGDVLINIIDVAILSRVHDRKLIGLNV